MPGFALEKCKLFELKPSNFLPLWRVLRATVKSFVLSFSVCHRLQLHSSSDCYGYWYWVVWALAICFSAKSSWLAQTTFNAYLNWATWFSNKVIKEQSLIFSSVLAVVAVTAKLFGFYGSLRNNGPSAISGHRGLLWAGNPSSALLPVPQRANTTTACLLEQR